MNIKVYETDKTKFDIVVFGEHSVMNFLPRYDLLPRNYIFSILSEIHDTVFTNTTFIVSVIALVVVSPEEIFFADCVSPFISYPFDVLVTIASFSETFIKQDAPALSEARERNLAC